MENLFGRLFLIGGKYTTSALISFFAVVCLFALSLFPGGHLFDCAQDAVPLKAVYAARQPRDPGRERVGRALRRPELHCPVQEPLWGVRGRAGIMS